MQYPVRILNAQRKCIQPKRSKWSKTVKMVNDQTTWQTWPPAARKKFHRVVDPLQMQSRVTPTGHHELFILKSTMWSSDTCCTNINTSKHYGDFQKCLSLPFVVLQSLALRKRLSEPFPAVLRSQPKLHSATAQKMLLPRCQTSYMLTARSHAGSQLFISNYRI